MTVDKYRKRLLLGLIVLSLALYLPLLDQGLSSLVAARLLGFLGLQLIWWQVVLGNRIVNRFITRDLIWVNKLHQIMGKYGLLIILLHPALMILNLGASLIWPPLNVESRFDQGVSLGSAALVILALVWFTSALVRKHLSWRWWKRLHLAAYLVLPLLFAHVLFVSPSIEQFAWLKYWVYFLMLSFLGVVLLRLADWAAVLGKASYKIVKVSRPAKKVTRLQMRPKRGALLPLPGQFAYLQINRFRQPHPFTISHFDDKTFEISFSIKAVGPYSSELARLKSGDTVFVDGPYGTFTRELVHKSRPVVVIAGGIGLTPFIRWLKSRRVNYFFLGCRTEDDIAYKKTIDGNGARACFVLSGESNKPGYLSGYVTIDLIAKSVKGSLTQYEYFICGPPPMMDKLTKDLISKGVGKDQIHLEKFSL